MGKIDTIKNVVGEQGTRDMIEAARQGLKQIKHGDNNDVGVKAIDLVVEATLTAANQMHRNPALVEPAKQLLRHVGEKLQGLSVHNSAPAFAEKIAWAAEQLGAAPRAAQPQTYRRDVNTAMQRAGLDPRDSTKLAAFANGYSKLLNKLDAADFQLNELSAFGEAGSALAGQRAVMGVLAALKKEIAPDLHNVIAQWAKPEQVGDVLELGLRALREEQISQGRIGWGVPQKVADAVAQAIGVAPSDEPEKWLQLRDSIEGAVAKPLKEIEAEFELRKEELDKPIEVAGDRLEQDPAVMLRLQAAEDLSGVLSDKISDLVEPYAEKCATEWRAIYKEVSEAPPLQRTTRFMVEQEAFNARVKNGFARQIESVRSAWLATQPAGIIEHLGDMSEPMAQLSLTLAIQAKTIDLVFAPLKNLPPIADEVEEMARESVTLFLKDLVPSMDLEALLDPSFAATHFADADITMAARTMRDFLRWSPVTTLRDALKSGDDTAFKEALGAWRPARSLPGIITKDNIVRAGVAAQLIRAHQKETERAAAEARLQEVRNRDKGKPNPAMVRSLSRIPETQPGVFNTLLRRATMSDLRAALGANPAPCAAHAEAMRERLIELTGDELGALLI